MNGRQYFVILYEEELEMDETPATKLVYQSIKSFTAKGTLPCIESYLSIAKRAGISDVWTKKSINDLLAKGWLIEEGKETKRGGSCPILRIRTSIGLNSYKALTQLRIKGQSSPNSVSSSSNSLQLSSKSSGTNMHQSNKEKSNEKFSSHIRKDDPHYLREYWVEKDQRWHCPRLDNGQRVEDLLTREEYFRRIAK